MFEMRTMAPLLQVFDMAVSIRFYRDVLGFAVVLTDGQAAEECDWVMLRRDGVELMLNTAFEMANRPAEMDAVRIAAHRDTTFYFGCPDVDAVYEHLRAAGVVCEAPKVAWYGMKQIYLSDPDGYLVCFQWRADGAGR